jgi:hypothetical protein
MLVEWWPNAATATGQQNSVPTSPTPQQASHLHHAPSIIYLHMLLGHDVELLQGVGMLRVSNVSNVLQTFTGRRERRSHCGGGSSF